MPDFSWTRNHDLIRSRAEMKAAFSEQGFQFIDAEQGLARNQRPRAIGTKTAPQSRIELIGPDDIVFKATLMVNDLNGEAQFAEVMPELVRFVETLVPGWQDGDAWVRQHVPSLKSSHMTTVQFGELVIDIRARADGKGLIMGITWQP